MTFDSWNVHSEEVVEPALARITAVAKAVDSEGTGCALAIGIAAGFMAGSLYAARVTCGDIGFMDRAKVHGYIMDALNFAGDEWKEARGGREG